MNKRTFFNLALVIACSYSIMAPAANQTNLKKVLFVGNSYLYYNDSLHNHVERMAIERHSGSTASSFEFKSATIGGALLKNHNLDWLLTPSKIGAQGRFQVVIMQGASFEPLTPEGRQVFFDTTKSYADKVRQVGAEPMLFMTHAYVPPHSQVDENMINIVHDTYVEAGQAVDAKVIPVGLAYARSYRLRPKFSLHMDFDGTHPNLRGTYLGACVVYLSLYEDDLKGLKYNYFQRLPKDEALYLQDVARETLNEFRKHPTSLSQSLNFN